MNRHLLIPLACAALLPTFACTDDAQDTGTTFSTFDGTGDGDLGDGDGDDTSGDGDGDSGDGDGDAGDGDGDGDGDGNAFCGDGVVEGDEQCDDGNPLDTDACTNACMSAVCGDGIVQAGVEECDDGNPTDTDACTSMCVTAVCGDGLVQAGVEECDDQNDINTDACVEGCLAAVCGDGFVQENVETCDSDENCNDSCDGVIALPYCIDYRLEDPNAPNGMYVIDPDGAGGNDPYDVYCDMVAGGHTVWAVTHDWGEWGSNMTIVIRDRLANGVGTNQAWTSTCQLFNTTNYAGMWKNNGGTYSQMQYLVWADANDYWLNYAKQMFPQLTHNDILILQDWQSPQCWAHYAEAGSMTAFQSPGGDGYAFCRDGANASKRYHIYLCL